MAVVLSHHAVKDVGSPLQLTLPLAYSDSSVYHAHETTAVEAFAIALLCGDVRCDVSITDSFNRGTKLIVTIRYSRVSSSWTAIELDSLYPIGKRC